MKEKRLKMKQFSKKSFVWLGIFAGILTGVLMSLQFSPLPSSGSSSSQPLQYEGYVCVYKTEWLGDRYGEKQLVDCSHNVLYNNGQNMSRDVLGGAGNYTIRNISLCNSTGGASSPFCETPAAAGGDANFFTPYNGSGACGLASTQGGFAIVPTSAGNWSIYTTFTSSCDNRITNVTRLTNITGGIFAGNAFTSVTLQNNDQLTVNWTISVT